MTKYIYQCPVCYNELEHNSVDLAMTCERCGNSMTHGLAVPEYVAPEIFNPILKETR